MFCPPASVKLRRTEIVVLAPEVIPFSNFLIRCGSRQMCKKHAQKGSENRLDIGYDSSCRLLRHDGFVFQASLCVGVFSEGFICAKGTRVEVLRWYEIKSCEQETVKSWYGFP